jgi:hypothetical protein
MLFGAGCSPAAPDPAAQMRILKNADPKPAMN